MGVGMDGIQEYKCKNWREVLSSIPQKFLFVFSLQAVYDNAAHRTTKRSTKLGLGSTSVYRVPILFKVSALCICIGVVL